MPQAPPLATAQDAMEVATLKNQIPNVEVPPQLHPFLRTLKFISMDASSGFGFSLEATATGQVACEDLTTAKAKALNSKHVQKRRTTASTPATTIFPLNTPLGNGSRLTSPLGQEPQGPSLVDNDLELDVDFSLDMLR
jgi:hypothetical protein